MYISCVWLEFYCIAVNLVTFIREIHPLDPQPHRHSMLVLGYVRLGLRGVAWGSIGHVIQKEAGRMSGRMLAGRQPILGYTGYLWLIEWEAAKFDDACTVPTPCLILPAFIYDFLCAKCYVVYILLDRIKSNQINILETRKVSHLTQACSNVFSSLPPRPFLNVFHCG